MAGAAGGAAGGQSGSAGTGVAGSGGQGLGGGGGGGTAGSGGTAGGPGGGTAGSGGGTGGAGGSGAKPVITFVTPTAGSKLCGAGNSTNGCIADADAAAAGWQGTVTVKVTLDGVPVTTGNANLSIGGLAFVSKPLDATGSATFANSTMPEGPTVPLVAQTDDIPGRGVGMAALNLLVDTIPPSAAPTSLVATPLDRRQTSFSLSWVAPGDGAATVASYDIHVKAVTNSACGAEVKAVPFSGTPVAPGMAQGFMASDLRIETPYCFTVAAKDGVGNVSNAVGTVQATAHFNQTIIPAPGGAASNAAFGYSADGSTDLNGDGKTDLLVGTFSGSSAYIYFGSATFSVPSAPSVQFDGNPSSKFGFAANVVGDIDADGLPDIAISSSVDGVVYIFKGRAWTAGTTLNLGNADYRIVADASFAGATFGASLVRLGDFNGDGADDFAITAPGKPSGPTGRVVIVLGKIASQAQFPATVMLPNTMQTITITGENAGDLFGITAVGLGKFYPGAGTTLIVSARFYNSRAGRVYAFRGQSGTAGAIAATSADNVIDGPAAGNQYSGFLSVIGPIGGALPGVGLGNPSVSAGTVNGNSIVAFGTAATGPFGGTTYTFVNSAASSSLDAFGTLVLGGGFSGTSVTASILGDATPDLVFAAATEAGAGGNNHVYVIDGARVSKLPTSATTDVSMIVDAKITLPASWAQVSLRSDLIRDINGDGYADLAIGGYSGAAGAGAMNVIW